MASDGHNCGAEVGAARNSAKADLTRKNPESHTTLATGTPAPKKGAAALLAAKRSGELAAVVRQVAAEGGRFGPRGAGAACLHNSPIFPRPRLSAIRIFQIV